MDEAAIVINGISCSVEQSMTIRVALEALATDLHANGLGDDQHGQAMTHFYMLRLNEVRAMIFDMEALPRSG